LIVRRFYLNPARECSHSPMSKKEHSGDSEDDNGAQTQADYE